jgi:hypothetical protein
LPCISLEELIEAELRDEEDSGAEAAE